MGVLQVCSALDRKPLNITEGRPLSDRKHCHTDSPKMQHYAEHAESDYGMCQDFLSRAPI